MKLKLTASAIALALSFSATSAELTTFTAGEAAVAADVNANFTAVAMDAANAQTAAATAQTAADANATAIETNVDAIAANSATVTANTVAVETNAAALMAVTQAAPAKWQLVNEAGEVVGNLLGKNSWGTVVELTGEQDGLVVGVTFGTGTFTAYGNTYKDAMNRITTLHQDAEYTNLYYRSEDCSGDEFLQANWNAVGAEMNIAEIQYTVGGGRVLAAKVGAEFYSVALDSEMIAMSNAPTELMSKMSSNGICVVSGGSSYYDYIKAEAEGELTDLVGSEVARGRFGFEMPSMVEYSNLDLGNTSIVRK